MPATGLFCSHHQGWHGRLQGEPARLQWMRHEATVLPQHDSPQDHAQRARAIEGCRARDRKDTAVHGVSARSQEGGDAVRPPQTHPEARPITATRAFGSARRVPASGDRTEPETNGQVVDGRSTSSQANNSVMFGRRSPRALVLPASRQCVLNRQRSNRVFQRNRSEAVVWQIDRALFLPIERLVLLPQLARELAQQGSDSAFPWIARN